MSVFKPPITLNPFRALLVKKRWEKERRLLRLFWRILWLVAILLNVSNSMADTREEESSL